MPGAKYVKEREYGSTSWPANSDTKNIVPTVFCYNSTRTKVSVNLSKIRLIRPSPREETLSILLLFPSFFVLSKMQIH